MIFNADVWEVVIYVAASIAIVNLAPRLMFKKINGHRWLSNFLTILLNAIIVIAFVLFLISLA